MRWRRGKRRWGEVSAGVNMYVCGESTGGKWVEKLAERWGRPCEKELIKVTFVGDAWGSEASFGTCVCGAKLTVNTNNQSVGAIERWRQWNEGERLQQTSSELAGGGLAGAFTGWKCLQNRPTSPLTEESTAALLLSSYCVEACFSF